jgi:broad specificity phosphatase PhoE
VETAEPLARAAGLEVRPDERLGYNAPDLAGFVTACARQHPGGAVVAVSHGDLIPSYLAVAGLLAGMPRFRTGSLFRLELRDGRPRHVTLVDRGDLAP